MKAVRVAAFVLVCSAFGACAITRPRSLPPVPFRVVESFAAPGDWLAVEDVRCNRAQLVASATIRVRGHYRLASTERGTLLFGLSNGVFDGDTSREITSGEGAFDFTMYVREPGFAHVSIYSPEKHDPNDNCIVKCRFDVVLPR